MSQNSSGRVSLPTELVVVFLSVLVGSTASAQTLSTLAGFNGINGSAPYLGSLVSDAGGNLFGTTSYGGANGDGTVFEIVKTASGYTAAPVVLASFNDSDGAHPSSGLIIDANGDLFGTTNSGGAFEDGTVFEIANTTTGYASTPTTLVNFDVDNGGFPESSLIADANGNLFGTTVGGGAFGDGTVFEIAKTATGYASTPTTLVSFDGDDGASPIAGLVADSNGDLFGTTRLDGAYGFGTAFEIVNTTSGYDPAPVTLVSFEGTEGEYPYSTLITDANGDLFGTTRSGGTLGYGTVFEIANTTSGYDSAPVTLVNFEYTNGANPYSGLIADSNGNLFGTTESGGTSGDGTIFEVANTTSGFSSTPATLINFDGANGENPYSGLIVDASGDLFGTTYSGGSSLDGTVYEVTGSGFVPPKQFAGTPGTPNCVGDSISTLAHTYGGIAHGAASMGYASVADLQSAVANYCSQ